MDSPNSSTSSRVFLLGAGFSKAVDPKMPTIAELRNRIDEHLISGLPEEFLFGDDFELTLTYLTERQPWMSEARHLYNRALFLKIAAVIPKCVETKSGAYAPWLADLVRRWGTTHSTVITLNYDDIVEKTAEEQNIEVDYGTVLGTPTALTGLGRISYASNSSGKFTLLKLHGSVTWAWTGEGYPGEPVYLDPCQELKGFVPFVVPPIASKEH